MEAEKLQDQRPLPTPAASDFANQYLNSFVDQHLWGNCKEVLTGIFGFQNKGYQLLTEKSGDLPLGILIGACSSAFWISYSDLDLVSV